LCVQDGEIAVYRPVTLRLLLLSTESRRWETGRHPGGTASDDIISTTI